MAFANKNFSVAVYSNGYTGWIYKSFEENIEDIIKDDYFQKVGDLLCIGDSITIVAKNTTDIYYVSGLKEVVQLKKLGC